MAKEWDTTQHITYITLPKTKSSRLKTGRVPKGKDRVPTVHIQVQAVSFREGMTCRSQPLMLSSTANLNGWCWRFLTTTSTTKRLDVAAISWQFFKYHFHSHVLHRWNWRKTQYTLGKLESDPPKWRFGNWFSFLKVVIFRFHLQSFPGVYRDVFKEHSYESDPWSIRLLDGKKMPYSDRWRLQFLAWLLQRLWCQSHHPHRTLLWR